MVLIFFRLVPSFNLSLPLFIFPSRFPSSSSLTAPQSRPLPRSSFPFATSRPSINLFHPHSFSPSRLHSLPVSQSRRVPPALALPSSSGFATSQSCPCFSRSLCPDLHSPSLPLAIFLHLELSLSCLFSISRPSVNPSGTPSLSYLSFSSGLSILPGLAPPSHQGYTSVLQMFRPSQI